MSTWKASPAEVDVVYPPAYEEISTGFDREGVDLGEAFDVVSVGAFSPDKRQLEQIQIARMVPEARFGIIARIWSQRYFSDCERYIRKHNISNVILLTNISRAKLKHLLAKLKVFLHTRHYEHFGVATVERLLLREMSRLFMILEGR